MEGPRGVRHKEWNEVLRLVNLAFRTMGGRPPTMAEEYPLLFDEYLVMLDDHHLADDIAAHQIL